MHEGGPTTAEVRRRYESTERARRVREAYWGSEAGIKTRLRAVHAKRERAIHGTRTP
jgi:hypothetical protein